MVNKKVPTVYHTRPVGVSCTVCNDPMCLSCTPEAKRLAAEIYAIARRLDREAAELKQATNEEESS